MNLGDDLKINLLPSPQKSFDSMFGGGFEDFLLDKDGKLHEVTEVSDTGEVLDVNDLNDEELGKFSLKLKIKTPKINIASLKSVKAKLLPKTFNKLISKVKKVRSAKKMGPTPKNAKRHVVIKSGNPTIHAGILAGTNTKLVQIHSLLKRNALQKQATSEHKAIVKKTKHKSDVLARLSRIENKLGTCSVKPKRRTLWLP